MSEFEPRREAGKQNEVDPKKVEKLTDKNYERIREEAELAEANKQSLEKIRQEIEKTAESKKKLEAQTLKQAERQPDDTVMAIGSQLKKTSFNQKVREVQRRETKRDRTLSKVIHQPVVESISNVAEGTVARPSGLLFAGVFASLGSVVVLIICRYYGYEYNFMIGLACLAIGFVVGLILEFFYRIVKRAKR